MIWWTDVSYFQMNSSAAKDLEPTANDHKYSKMPPLSIRFWETHLQSSDGSGGQNSELLLKNFRI